MMFQAALGDSDEDNGAIPFEQREALILDVQAARARRLASHRPQVLPQAVRR
jgi:hypothetical protein